MTAAAPDGYLPLFVYGTLRDHRTFSAVAGEVVLRRAPARAPGHRHTVAAPYPAVSFGAGDDEIAGELLWLDRAAFARAIRHLDSYEGTPHLFRRTRIRAQQAGGDRVEAYAYEWAGD